MAQKADGMNYAPQGKPSPVVKPGEFIFAASHLEHGHIYGQCNVPALPAGLTYVEIAGGTFHSLARRSDGSIVGWGANAHGQCDAPALPLGTVYVEVSAAGSHTAARRAAVTMVLLSARRT